MCQTEWAQKQYEKSKLLRSRKLEEDLNIALQAMINTTFLIQLLLIY